MFRSASLGATAPPAFHPPANTLAAYPVKATWETCRFTAGAAAKTDLMPACWSTALAAAKSLPSMTHGPPM
jgi:hypothetical protein